MHQPSWRKYYYRQISFNYMRVSDLDDLLNRVVDSTKLIGPRAIRENADILQKWSTWRTRLKKGGECVPGVSERLVLPVIAKASVNKCIQSGKMWFTLGLKVPSSQIDFMSANSLRTNVTMLHTNNKAYQIDIRQANQSETVSWWTNGPWGWSSGLTTKFPEPFEVSTAGRRLPFLVRA